MLRITIHHEAATMRFVIEGRLVGPWVEELKKCWQAATCPAHGPPLMSTLPIQVDLSAMTLVDREGKALLAEMHRHGAKLSAVGLMTQAIIEEITRLSSRGKL